MQMLRNFTITFVVFMAIDLVWLGFIAKNLYSKYLGYIMTDKVNWGAAILFYVLFIIGLLFFVISPALDKNSWTYALGAGALYGLLTYATYDLTNLATLKDWPIAITVIDMIWGTTLASLTSIISFSILQKL
ncbi:MAG: DUF2177 family protein [Clostridiales bacterium]|nr:DUF2177 family protein [Clostridiales bacterium]